MSMFLFSFFSQKVNSFFYLIFGLYLTEMLNAVILAMNV
jgi:hypothetical protein